MFWKGQYSTKCALVGYPNSVISQSTEINKEVFFQDWYTGDLLPSQSQAPDALSLFAGLVFNKESLYIHHILSHMYLTVLGLHIITVFRTLGNRNDFTEFKVHVSIRFNECSCLPVRQHFEEINGKAVIVSFEISSKEPSVNVFHCNLCHLLVKHDIYNGQLGP